MKIPEDVMKIWKRASSARELAYAPYSKFQVGAAFRSGTEIVSGCNIENASFGAGLCAERVAIFKAISAGKKSMRDLVVVADTKKATPPCGLCLQVLSEFAPRDLRIWMGNTKKILKVAKLSDLLPVPFSL